MSPPASNFDELRTTASVFSLTWLNRSPNVERIVSPSTWVPVRKAMPRMTARHVPIRRRLWSQIDLKVRRHIGRQSPNALRRSSTRGGVGSSMRSTIRPSARKSASCE